MLLRTGLYRLMHMQHLKTLGRNIKPVSLRRSISSTPNYCASYELTVQTGDIFGAGTDANVFVKMIGDVGTSPEFTLPTEKQDMEKGMVNKYRVAADDVGPIRKLIIGHDGAGVGPAWYLEKVSIKDESGEIYNFKCQDWLIRYGNEQAIKLLNEDTFDAMNDSVGSMAKGNGSTNGSINITGAENADLTAVYNQILSKNVEGVKVEELIDK